MDNVEKIDVNAKVKITGVLGLFTAAAAGFVAGVVFKDPIENYFNGLKEKMLSPKNDDEMAKTDGIVTN